MAWRGSFSRTFIARASSLRSSPPITRLSSPLLSAPRLRPRRLSFANPRSIPNLLLYNLTLGALACAQSLLPVAGARLTSHFAVNVRACCELSHGNSGYREEREGWVMHSGFHHQKAVQ
ncbi:hypothetical protein RJ640_018684 [Escallonia rubra]|uniref:Uncharacterized protein n=1 Tax=Escallonia rubra TaxID=112253 RepID=A0AA88U7T0_9ASTE|nr:hypothetical protein RJ640_018684 [Escallonia rubra]